MVAILSRTQCAKQPWVKYLKTIFIYWDQMLLHMSQIKLFLPSWLTHWPQGDLNKILGKSFSS